MRLFYNPMSGHAHRAHLFLSLAGIPHELKFVDLAAGEHRTDEFLRLNAFGEIPVLDDDGVVIADSNAILVYAARKADASHWLPHEPTVEAEVQRWLSVAAGKIAYGCCAARLVTVFGKPFDAAEVIKRAYQTLEVVDLTLQTNTWIARTSDPTIADVALYSYIERVGEGNVDRTRFHAITMWLQRIENLKGFVPFVKTNAGLETGALR